MLNSKSKSRNTINQRTVMLTAVLTMIIFSASGQHYKVQEFDMHLKHGISLSDSAYHIITDAVTTGIVLKIDVNEVFDGAFLIVGNDTLFLSQDEDGDASNLYNYSNLLTFSPPIGDFYFSPGKIRSQITFYFINAQTPKPDSSGDEVKKKSEDCSEPEMIDQSVWRAGLEDPDYERIYNVVHNIIIHHSAGSNTDTDYINVIRNIYIYHTEIRGWSDIGYNYLIAQDGSLFKGRDPGTYEQDEVLGAHFCNSNTGTLGICIMGTYSELHPPKAAIGSLINLVTWIMGKDSLNPLGTYSHPLNSTLPVLAGHRDGCATMCPGDSLYFLLDSIRNEVMTAFSLCGYTVKPVSLDRATHEDVIVIKNENGITFLFNNFCPDHIIITDMLGRRRKFMNTDSQQDELILKVHDLPPGIYFVSIFRNGYVSAVKFSIY